MRLIDADKILEDVYPVEIMIVDKIRNAPTVDFGVDLDRLKELAEADKEGRCLVLPCKVGDTVYYIYKDCPKDYKPQYCTDHLGSCENCTHRVAAILKTTFTLSMIDNVKNIYLTKQEAEKALEGLK